MPELLRFAYRDSEGEVTKRELKSWTDDGVYLKGFDLTVGQVRTFRKDRIETHFDSAEVFLASPVNVARRLPRGPSAPHDERPPILFTGFSAARRADLERRSDAAGLRVVKSVVAGLAYMCLGPNAGPKKLEQALHQRVFLLLDPDVDSFLETGELPNYSAPVDP